MTDDTDAFALAFTRALCSRDYELAYGMTSSDYRRRVSVREMQDRFEMFVPPDWGETEPVQVGAALPEWPGKEPDDVGWVFVSISGDVYSEGLAAVVGRQEGDLRIRNVEWGRP